LSNLDNFLAGNLLADLPIVIFGDLPVLGVAFLLGIIVLVLLLLFFNLIEDGSRPRSEYVLRILAIFQKVPLVPKVENLLQLDVLLQDRVLDVFLQLNGEGKELGGRQVDFLILDRELQIDEVLAELGIVLSCHEESVLLQSILNDLESLAYFRGDPSCDTSLLRDLDLKGIDNSHNVAILFEHVTNKFDVFPFVRVVHRLHAGLGIEILNDLFELLLELILDVADSVKFWVKQAPEISDNLGRLIELLKH
jgi:hypothetical protein